MPDEISVKKSETRGNELKSSRTHTENDHV